jgi:hypothetical protein
MMKQFMEKWVVGVVNTDLHFQRNTVLNVEMIEEEEDSSIPKVC